MNDIYSEIEKIKKNRYIFGCLCRATIQLNNIFSFPTLIAISSKLITSVYALFSILSQLRRPNPLLAQITNFNYAGLFFYFFIVDIFVFGLTGRDLKIKISATDTGVLTM